MEVGIGLALVWVERGVNSSKCTLFQSILLGLSSSLHSRPILSQSV